MRLVIWTLVGLPETAVDSEDDDDEEDIERASDPPEQRHRERLPGEGPPLTGQATSIGESG